MGVNVRSQLRKPFLKLSEMKEDSNWRRERDLARPSWTRPSPDWLGLARKSRFLRLL